MFSTYEAFRLPLQLDRQSTTWSAVELTVRTPHFLLTTVTDDDDLPRTFLLNGTGELLAFAKEPAWQIADLNVLQPPRWSGCSEWALVPMREVLLQEAPPDGSIPSAVARAVNGTLFGGFPVEPLKGDQGPLSPLAAVGAKK